MAAAATTVAHVPAAAQLPTLGWCTDQSTAVILGDSTATGYGSTGYDGGNADPFEPTEYGWSARLARQLPDTEVINLARNGAMASDFLPTGVGVQRRPAGNLVPTAVATIQAEQPDLIIIAVGANELGTGRHPVTTYGANLTDLTNRIRAVAPLSTILYSHTWGFTYRWGAGTYYPWPAYADVMADAAVGVASWYQDMTKTMTVAGEDTAGLYVEDEYGPGNSVHTTDAGHQVQFATYWGTVNSC